MGFSILPEGDEDSPPITSASELADWIDAELLHLDGFDSLGLFLGHFHRSELELIVRALQKFARETPEPSYEP